LRESVERNARSHSNTKRGHKRGGRSWTAHYKDSTRVALDAEIPFDPFFLRSKRLLDYGRARGDAFVEARERVFAGYVATRKTSKYQGICGRRNRTSTMSSGVSESILNPARSPNSTWPHGGNRPATNGEGSLISRKRAPIRYAQSNRGSEKL
jgi:hypothetical protein